MLSDMTALPYDYEEYKKECQGHKGLDDTGEDSHHHKESELGAGSSLWRKEFESTYFK